mmetsp:Transcript_9900/g.21760  ORF Transcript_9900/g.21760 Transcript_9900/m.21760 type:complete len:292 (+) Transcript_9900:128-1003(+)
MHIAREALRRATLAELEEVVMHVLEEQVYVLDLELHRVHVDAGRPAPHPHAALHKLRQRHLRLHVAERLEHDPGVRGLKPENAEEDAALVGLDHLLVLGLRDHSVMINVKLVEDLDEGIDVLAFREALLEDHHVLVGLGGADGLVHEHAREQVEDAEVEDQGEQEEDRRVHGARLREQLPEDVPVQAACGAHVEGDHAAEHRAEVEDQHLRGAPLLLAVLPVVVLDVWGDELNKEQGEDPKQHDEQDDHPHERLGRHDEGVEHHAQLPAELQDAQHAQDARDLEQPKRAQE